MFGIEMLLKQMGFDPEQIKEQTRQFLESVEQLTRSVQEIQEKQTLILALLQADENNGTQSNTLSIDHQDGER